MEVPMANVRVPMLLLLVVVSSIGGAILSGNLPRAISQEAAPPKPCDVAVIDISKVFEKYAIQQKEMERLKSEVNSFELVLKQAQQDVADLKQQLEAQQKGTDE